MRHIPDALPVVGSIFDPRDFLRVVRSSVALRAASRFLYVSIFANRPPRRAPRSQSSDDQKLLWARRVGEPNRIGDLRCVLVQNQELEARVPH